MNHVASVYWISALIVNGAIVTWMATGSEGYTRWPDAKLAQSDAPPSGEEIDLLADIGFVTNDEVTKQPHIESRFAFGLVPGGLDLKHMPSVATAGVVAIAMSSIATVVHVRRKRSHQHEKPLQP